MKTALFSLGFLVLLGSPAFGQMDHYAAAARRSGY